MLYIIATPIGNLKDITLRALETLKSVDLILCEDTRLTQKLLTHYQIKTPTMSYHQHTPERKVKEIIQLLSEGKNLALVTDAGTPGISDPGNKLISRITYHVSHITYHVSHIIPVPGPSAVVTALSISGFPTDKFLFLGFPPRKNKRQKFLKEAAGQSVTVIFYESSHRVLKTLEELKQYLPPEKSVVVCRELTKQFETIYRGTLSEIIDKIIKDPIKGEYVVAFYGK